MKILFFADNFPPEKNAQASRVFERACYWVRWGHEVTVLTCAPNFPEGKVYQGYRNSWHTVEDIAGIRVVRVKSFIAANEGRYLRIVDFLSYMITAYAAGLLESKPDLVVATSPQFFAALGGWALALTKRVPFIFELSDLWPASIVGVGAMGSNLFLRWMEKLELFLYRRSARVVALTSAFKRDLIRRGIPEDKIYVVINGVDLPRFAPRPRDQELAARWGIQPQHFVVGYIGTHGMAHALENVLDAAGRVSDPSMRFLFVGTGAARESLVSEGSRRGLKNVIFVPAQPKDQMPAFWSLCDVALVHLKNTSVFETVIPSKIFEAMGMGLPILLAAPQGEASSILVSEKAGLWVPPENPSALAQAAIRFKKDRTLYDQLRTTSLAAAPRFSREKQASDMLDVLLAADQQFSAVRSKPICRFTK